MSECDKKKYSGTIEINGKIFLDEFYGVNGGQSDADTVKIFLTSNSIKFRKNEGSDWQNALTLFNNAFIYDPEDGRRKNIVTKDARTNQYYIKIRLQGMDAPELHYKANRGDLFLFDLGFSKFGMLNELFEFRQNWGIRATKELAKFLELYSVEENGRKVIDAFAFSEINSPSDLFDRFGRAVADIIISANDINLNQWLVEEGWAFTEFYDSMSNEEIIQLKNKGKSASSLGKGILPSYKKELVRFDFDLVFEKDESKKVVETDKGSLNMPKFFRKQVDYEILKKSGYKHDKTLKAFIRSRKSECYLVEDFLNNRHCAEKHTLSEFIDDNGSMTVEPGNLVNIESDSQIETPNVLNNWY